MKVFWIVCVALLAALVIGLSFMASSDVSPVAGSQALSATSTAAEPIRIGLIPERDIFALRKRNQVLADYLSEKLNRPVVLVTGNSYATILKDFAENKVDVAFLGSLVAVLAVDRLGAQVVAKTQLPEGVSTYTGVICVPEDSPIKSVKDLAGKSIALVRTTTGGNLFPLYSMERAGVLDGERPPHLVWVGTHDDAINALAAGKVDAAGAKNLRLAAWLKANPDKHLRVVDESGPVPENALVVRGDLADNIGLQVARILLAMDSSDKGKVLLQEYGASRFVPCGTSDYKVIYDMASDLNGKWRLMEIDGPAPKWPTTAPSK